MMLGYPAPNYPHFVGLHDASKAQTSLLLGEGTSPQSQVKCYLEEGMCYSNIADFQTLRVPKGETKDGYVWNVVLSGEGNGDPVMGSEHEMGSARHEGGPG